MTISSINTIQASFSAQANIATAQQETNTSVARLSSGNRIIQASQDVAGLAIGTSLATNVSTLRTALTNSSQATSLLQVADSAGQQITEILQRQLSIAVQAGSGTLGDTERAFLDAEFQALTSEIDRIAENTNFNGVSLLNGALDAASAFSNNAAQATSGSLNIAFSGAIAAAETIEINGVTLTAAASGDALTGLDFNVGATTAETVENLAARLNSLATDNSIGISSADRLALAEASFASVGQTLEITSRAGGELTSGFTVDLSGATTSATTNGEANVSGQFSGTSFNLFSNSTVASLTQVISGAGTSDAVPFDAGESLTLTIGGVENTLHTFGTGDTFENLVDGINANAGTTGVSAEAVFDGSNYNVRLSYESQNGVAIVDAGDTFDSTVFKLSGDNVDFSTGFIDTAADQDDATKSIVATDGFRNLFATDLTDTAITSATTDITDAGATAALPLSTGGLVTAEVNGQSQVLHTLIATDTLTTIAAGINANTATSGIRAEIVQDVGGTDDFNIRLYASDPSGIGAATGINVAISGAVDGSATVAAGTVLANPTTGATRVSEAGLVGGANDGLGIGDTTFTSSSSVGDSILTDLSTTRANSDVLLTQNATAGQNLVIGSTTFVFTANTTGASNEILIGSSIADTLDNAVNTINSYAQNGAVGSEAFELSQLNISRSGDSLSIEAQQGGNVLSITGAAVGITTSVTGATPTSANLSNAPTTFGVNIDGVSNSAFAGTISGFAAEHTGTADQVNLSVTVGDSTYTAANVDLTNAGDETVRFLSDDGGYFDVQLQGSEVSGVSSQADADNVAARLDAAFSGLSFVQNREVSSFEGGGAFTVNGTVTGSLLGTNVSAQLDNFDSISLTDVSVTTATGSATDASISLNVGGVEFSSANGIGTTLGANQTFRLTSAEDANQFIEFTTGDTAIQLGNTDQASAFQDALQAAFGANSGSAGLNFQVGTDVSDTLSVSISDASTSTLYSGASLNVLTSASAATAVETITAAIDEVTSVRAGIGALQSRFNFASANIQASIQNQDSARATLLDADIASESTNFAINQVKLQAGISVLAQANQQVQNLLKLIG